MKKLFRLKKWLTLEETAKRLSASFGEEIKPADCLQFALDGHLVISAVLDESRYAVLAEQVITTKRKSLGFAIKRNTPDGAYIGLLNEELFFTNEELDTEYLDIKRNGGIVKISEGIYDLPMIGAEALDVMYAFESLRGIFSKARYNIEGAFLITSAGIVNIMESFNDLIVKYNKEGRMVYFDKDNDIPVDFDDYSNFFYPDDGLRSVEFVFKTEHIDSFERSTLDDNEGDLSLSESLRILGSVLDTLKNSETKSKRWTQESLKVEMVERNPALKQRRIDDYFSLSNKAYKSTH
ncbi:hypothetical protein [Klebsiella variicola]|uniref:hypothetical protein n=1 Tax=Klebsiella variicola TaxID=244366 RepID=UPI002B05EA30|nr:hypothetical protein [Klebsiella variicola]